MNTLESQPSPKAQFNDPLVQDIAQQYDRFQGSLESLERRRKYLNYGYTTNPAQSYEDRQEALCLKVFEAANVEPDHRLIDVGFGSGEQDFLWADRFAFKKLQGFNISSAQVDFANRRARTEDRAEQLQFFLGRAEELPGVERECVDRLLAVECAFYFDRAAFYRRASEVLAPGGLLVKADISFSTLATPLTRLRSDMARVGTLSSNRRLWEKQFYTRSVTPIHREVVPGVEMTVSEIKQTVNAARNSGDSTLEDQGRSSAFTAEQAAQWKSMAFWSRLVALGLRSRILRYDLIVLERR